MSEEPMFPKNNLSDLLSTHIDFYLKTHSAFPSKCGLYSLLIKEVERSLFETVFLFTHKNQSKSSEILGINRNTFRTKLKDLGLIDKKTKKKQR